MTTTETWALIVALLVAPGLLGWLLRAWWKRLPPGPLDLYPEDDE